MGKETHSRRFGKNSVIPAKAGIHRESARATSLWIPAFAGMTEGCANAGLMSLPTKYSDEPYIYIYIAQFLEVPYGYGVPWVVRWQYRLPTTASISYEQGRRQFPHFAFPPPVYSDQNRHPSRLAGNIVAKALRALMERLMGARCRSRQVNGQLIRINRGYAMPREKGSDQNVVTINIKMSVDGWKRGGSIGANRLSAGNKAIKQDAASALTAPGKNRLTYRATHEQ